MSTFATFVANKRDKDNAALTAALAAARDASGVGNPLVLYGRTGSGKTHLLYAIVNEMQRVRPDAVILHASARAYVDAMTQAIRSDAVNDFRRWTESFDAILLDDIHLFADRERTLHEIFWMLEARAAAGTRVVITSDVRLRGMNAQTEFVEVTYPDAAARAKIIQTTAERRGFALSDDEARAITRRTRGSARGLHAMVARLLAERVIVTDDGTAETLEGPERLKRRRFYERALRLRGELRLDIDLEQMRGRRR